MATNEFILLLGKAFLHELSAGDRDKAIAFGRALLVELDKCYGEPNGNGLKATQSIDSIA